MHALKRLAACLVPALLLTSCLKPPSETVTLQFAVWGSVEQLKAEQGLLDAFMQEHPNIRVQLVPGGARYTDKIQAMMVGNVAPDVFMVEMTQFDEWATRGVLLDVSEDLAEITGNAELMPVPKRAFVRDGRAFALPINSHAPVMFYNRDALEKAGIELPKDRPLTWDEFFRIAPRLTRSAQNPDSPTEYAALLPWFELLAESHGAQLFDDRFRPTRVTADSEAMRRAFEVYRTAYQSGSFTPPDVAMDQGTFQLFRDGRVAFHFEGRWRVPDFREIRAFRWDVASHVAGPASHTSVHGGNAIAVWSGTRHKEAARKFARFYASPRGSTLAMHLGRYVPPYRELAFGEEFLSLRPPPGIRNFSETMEEDGSRVMLYAPGLSEVRSILQRYAEQVIYRPERPIEDIQRDLCRALNRWLQRDLERRASATSSAVAVAP